METPFDKLAGVKRFAVILFVMETDFLGITKQVHKADTGCRGQL